LGDGGIVLVHKRSVEKIRSCGASLDLLPKIPPSNMVHDTADRDEEFLSVLFSVDRFAELVGDAESAVLDEFVAFLEGAAFVFGGQDAPIDATGNRDVNIGFFPEIESFEFHDTLHDGKGRTLSISLLIGDAKTGIIARRYGPSVEEKSIA
jgi:hypothetical protein